MADGDVTRERSCSPFMFPGSQPGAAVLYQRRDLAAWDKVAFEFQSSATSEDGGVAKIRSR